MINGNELYSRFDMTRYRELELVGRVATVSSVYLRGATEDGANDYWHLVMLIRFSKLTFWPDVYHI